MLDTLEQASGAQSAACAPDRERGWLAYFEAVVASALVSLAVFLLGWRYGFNLADEGWLWYVSKRTALGDVPFRDFFSYDPGRYYWSAAIFKLAGNDGFYEQLVANYLFAILGLALVYFAMCRAELTRTWRILILLLLGIVIGFPRHKIYEQTWSLVAAAAAAAVFRAPARIMRWLALGIVIGLAGFFGRNSGVFSLIAAVLTFLILRIRGHRLGLLGVLGAVGSGIIIGYLPVIVLIAALPGFRSPFFQSVLLTPHWAYSLPIPFPWRVHLRGLKGIDLLQARAVSWLSVAVPLTYAGLLVRGFRKKGPLDGGETLSVAASAAGAGFLIHAFYTADFFHIAQGVVPFVVAAGAFSASLWRGGERRRRWSIVLFGSLVVIVMASWTAVEPAVAHLRTQAHSPKAADKIRIDGRFFEVPGEQAEIMRTVEAAFKNCGAGDGGFFTAPYYPGLYAFLNTRSPVWDTYFLWPRSEPVQQAAIEALKRNRTALLLINREFAINGRESLKFRRTNPKLAAYVVTHFKRSRENLPGGFEL
ncbi:MAG: hypothetical protein J2P13_11565 [Acidobacteria bacterium]|nr:hypothetical protein [Acidobacteriota bacterium]